MDYWVRPWQPRSQIAPPAFQCRANKSLLWCYCLMNQHRSPSLQPCVCCRLAAIAELSRAASACSAQNELAALPAPALR